MDDWFTPELHSTPAFLLVTMLFNREEADWYNRIRSEDNQKRVACMSEEGRLACPEQVIPGIDSTEQDQAPNQWVTLCPVDSGKTCMANRDDTEKLLKHLLDC